MCGSDTVHMPRVFSFTAVLTHLIESSLPQSGARGGQVPGKGGLAGEEGAALLLQSPAACPGVPWCRDLRLSSCRGPAGCTHDPCAVATAQQARQHLRAQAWASSDKLGRSQINPAQLRLGGKRPPSRSRPVKEVHAPGGLAEAS